MITLALVMVTEDGRTQEVPLKKAVQVIGRQTDVALRIPSSTVSRHHCQITVDDSGKIEIKDLGSSNGTYVNRKKITQAILNAGDLIAVGNKVFVVKINGSPAEIDPEESYDDGFVLPPAPKQAAPTPAPTPAPTKASGATPASKPPLAPLAKDADDSGELDFDFLDEDEDMKKQPKL
jgi:pSer/pThr/pTyr-binding forkhead associated (FHA) protein